MKTNYRPRRAARLAAAAVLALLPVLASAQGIYRIVGPDGRVSFSDKPPAASEKATALGPSGRSADAGTGTGLPFELREAMSRYPVTLYSGKECDPCNAGRTLLTTRGIPFSEKTIQTQMDMDALQRQLGSNSIPVLQIGGQRLQGYQASEWNQYLDAAGYPSSSRLPSGYRNPSASPLVPLPEAPTAAPQQPETAPVAPPAPSPSNPAGIVF